MTQKTLPIKGQRYRRKVLSGVAGVVVLDRSDNEEIVLRFLGEGAAWGKPVQEVRLELGLAEQLQQLLSYELEDAAVRMI